MANLNKRLTWFLLLIISWIILIINGMRDKKIHCNFLQELKTLLKKHSKYTEDDDYILVRKEEL